jgi:hypothetical protein
MSSGSTSNVSRRQLVALGAAGAAGGMVTKASIGDAARVRRPRLGGIHIHVKSKIVQPKLPIDAFHTFIVTLWGPDHALSGMGCGFTEGNPVETLIGTGYVGCVFGAVGKADAGLVRGTGVMMYSGDPDEKRGQPFPFEANLATGFCRFTDMNYGMGTQIVAEGTGTVTRI